MRPSIHPLIHASINASWGHQEKSPGPVEGPGLLINRGWKGAEMHACRGQEGKCVWGRRGGEQRKRKSRIGILSDQQAERLTLFFRSFLSLGF
mmetsp:Transcript_40927/g.80704  ORF Transcript_40927/g.80704 Transcript_40927/m.80704 type:complete len:93 (-) Transcript_40927:1624-1902(-)